MDAVDSLPGGCVRSGQFGVHLLVHGLPLGWTHRLTVVSPGDDGVALVVQRGATVSGSVVEDGSNRLVPHAMVMHGRGPRGQVMVHADQYGRFQLADLPQGMVEIEAYVPARPPERILVTESAPALRPPRTGLPHTGLPPLARPDSSG